MMSRRMWAIVAPVAMMIVTLVILLGLHFLGVGRP
jgi:hypothetical protein